MYKVKVLIIFIFRNAKKYVRSSWKAIIEVLMLMGNFFVCMERFVKY